MTPWDRKLIERAYKTPYWNYKLVFEFVEMADSDEAKYKLNSIAELLFEVYQERGYYDPTKTKKVCKLWRGPHYLLKGIMQKLLGKKAPEED